VGEWLASAIGVALSPLPILAMLLVLGGRRPLATGSAFWIAWTLGVAAPTIAFVALAESAGVKQEDAGAIAAAEIAVGVAFLAIAARLAFRGRRERKDLAPGWLEALDRSGPARAAALGVLLSALNPKNLALMLAAAVAIAQAGDDAGGLAGATVGYVLSAVSTVSVLLAGYAAAPERARHPLASLRAFVARNDRTIALALGVVIGGFFLLDGLGSL
jgi:threonine/homoserine/homoserine lactone efflux protein